MPLSIEIYHSGIKRWGSAAVLAPGEIGSMSNNKPDGSREIIIFQCADDGSYSKILRSNDERRGMGPDIEEIKLLRDGDSFEMDIKPDRAMADAGPVSTRFTHTQ